MGLTFAPLSSAVVNAVPRNLEGQASGGYNAIRELGGVFGIAILGAIFQHVAALPTSASFIDGFRTAVFAGAAIVGLAVVIAGLLPNTAIHNISAEETAASVA